MLKLKIIKFAFLMLLLSPYGCRKAPPQAVENQSFSPARLITVSGCENLYKVSDNLYRGAQPTAEGFRELEKKGIKTVINLRSFHSDLDKLKETSLEYISIPMDAWNPKPEQVDEFLRVVSDPAKQPIFVHCQHGADRTGTMTAIYRIVIENWDVEKALNEMQYGPFGFHEIFSGLPKFIEDLDIESLRRKFASGSQ